jgi:hypothetical protein
LRKKVISLNVNVNNNDGLLANHIAQTERLSYAEAVEQIEDAVQNWKKELHPCCCPAETVQNLLLSVRGRTGGLRQSGTVFYLFR